MSWGSDWLQHVKGALESLFVWGGFWLSWFCVCTETSQMRGFFWGGVGEGVSWLLGNSFLLTHSLSNSRERVDQVVREKEKLRSDLDKAEKLKSLMASEVDDHHAAIERRNEYNLRCGPHRSKPQLLLFIPFPHNCPSPSPIPSPLLKAA